MTHNPLTRRSFLSSSAGAAAALALPSGILAPSWAKESMTQSIGVQLYTLRSLMENDVAGTLASVGAAGYQEVEFAGYFDQSFTNILRWLADSGLSAPSAHVQHIDFKNRFDAALEAAIALGHKNLFLSWLPPEDRTVRRYNEIAELLNKNGEKAQKAGIQLGYHNHEFEFEDLGGVRGYDILTANTDAQLVKFELDLYWLRVAGIDPASLISTHSGRFPCVHIKDYGIDGNIVDVGDGLIDYGTLYPVLKSAGVQHFFIEHDSTKNPILTLERSFDAFSTIVRGQPS